MCDRELGKELLNENRMNIWREAGRILSREMKKLFDKEKLLNWDPLRPFVRLERPFLVRHKKNE